MAKLSAWLVTLIGLVYLLPLIGVSALASFQDWIIALAFLVMGIGKLMRNYGKKDKPFRYFNFYLITLFLYLFRNAFKKGYSSLR